MGQGQGRVIAGMSMSLDGFIGGVGDLAWPTHERLLGWVFDLKSWRERLGFKGGRDNENSRILNEATGHPGAYVMGRRMFDAGETPWGDDPPFKAPVFVLTHRPRETVHREGGTSFTFVTGGIESAVAQARDAAGDRDIFISGGASAVQQAFAAGLLDEIWIHLIPVLLGDGVRLFDRPVARQIDLAPMKVVESCGVTHLHFRIVA